ncbi:MAG: hypothetical protein ACE5LU_28050, partial [Anaerolineae bacterium]
TDLNNVCRTTKEEKRKMKKQKVRKLISSVLIVVLVFVLVGFNVISTASAAGIMDPGGANACNGCSVRLTMDEMADVHGGFDVVGVVDGVCALTGIGSVFIRPNVFALAFCGGWGLGRYTGLNQSNA